MKSIKNCEKLLEMGFSKNEIRSRLKTKSSRNKNYWIERGYDEADAIKLAKSRMPGTFEYYHIYKEISDVEEATRLSKKFIKEEISKTESNYIRKFGKIEGSRRWKIYCDKQAYTNTFEYKHKKYGWDEETFDKYNKSRSVTLTNLIDRYGITVGTEKWNSYCERQSYTNTLSYYKEKYGNDIGEKKWKNLNKTKSHSLDTYLERYNGDIELATKKLTDFFRNLGSGEISSNISNQLFNELTPILLNKGYTKLFHHTYNHEWVINVKHYKTIFLDFYLRETGKVIEFFGDYWHCNPYKYKPDQYINIGGTQQKVSDVWENDKKRIDFILKIPYINDVKIVWETDYRNNPNRVINECIEYLTE